MSLPVSSRVKPLFKTAGAPAMRCRLIPMILPSPAGPNRERTKRFETSSNRSARLTPKATTIRPVGLSRREKSPSFVSCQASGYEKRYPPAWFVKRTGCCCSGPSGLAGLAERFGEGALLVDGSVVTNTATRIDTEATISPPRMNACADFRLKNESASESLHRRRVRPSPIGSRAGRPV